MKHETYKQSMKRINRNHTIIITIAMISPFLPIAILYFYGG